MLWWRRALKSQRSQEPQGQGWHHFSSFDQTLLCATLLCFCRGQLTTRRMKERKKSQRRSPPQGSCKGTQFLSRSHPSINPLPVHRKQTSQRRVVQKTTSPNPRKRHQPKKLQGLKTKKKPLPKSAHRRRKRLVLSLFFLLSSSKLICYSAIDLGIRRVRRNFLQRDSRRST